MKSFTITKNLTKNTIHMKDYTGKQKVVPYSYSSVDEIECAIMDDGYQMATSVTSTPNGEKVLTETWVKSCSR